MLERVNEAIQNCAGAGKIILLAEKRTGEQISAFEFALA
jgi:hypothetical protein